VRQTGPGETVVPEHSPGGAARDRLWLLLAAACHFTRVVAALVFLSLAAARSAVAQSSPYLPIDDPRLPLLEHLIARGDVADPSPMLRPFRFTDALRVLTAADTARGTSTGGLVHALREGLAADVVDAESWWRAELRAGGTAYTQKRRDLLHLGGPGDWNWYAEIGLRGVLGPFVAATRPAAEPRLIGDPDWPGTKQENVTGRLIEGYLGAQVKFASITYGQLERNWGPVGYWAIPLSNYGYQRQGLALSLGTGAIRLDAIASQLRSEFDTAGQRVNRYLFVHRLDARLSRRLRVAVWEASILQGVGRTLETPFANPLSVSVLANTFGINEEGNNVMIGTDLHWRIARGTTLEAQLAIDDFQFNHRDQTPDRWALTLSAFGPLGPRLSWRAFYTQASSLAFRTANPFENFVDAGVGTGRNFADMDLLKLTAAIPLGHEFLLAPELAVQRQGEGRINDPFPQRNTQGIIDVPGIFIGTVEHTYRLALGLTGRHGPLDISADAGFHHVTNDQNQPGVTANRFVGRIQATLGWRKLGTFK
jgi:hypothetical protein